jgi:hypothetical protein
MCPLTRPGVSAFELHVFQRIRVVSRTALVLSWLTIVTVSLSRGVPKSVALGVLEAFKVSALLGSIWVLFEFVEASLGRTSFKNPLIDALLTLPMFGFWFLVFVHTG